MEEKQLARVAELMGLMAGGDGVAGAVALQQEFAPSLRAAVRRAASRRGMELAHDVVEELMADVVLMLHDHGSGWQPAGGALPWVWAERRVLNIVDRHLGHFTDPLDETGLARAERAQQRDAGGPAPAAAAEPATCDTLQRLAETDVRARALWLALHEVTRSERDVELWLEVRLQERMGDRSPATTVGATLGMSPEAVRQQRHRIDGRLRRLLEADEGFAHLADVVGLAPLASLA